MIFRDFATKGRKDKKPSLGQRLLRGSSSNAYLDPTIPRTSNQAENLQAIPHGSALKIHATTSTTTVPIGTNASSTNASSVSRGHALSIQPDTTSTLSYLSSDQASQDSSSIHGELRNFGDKFKLGSRSHASGPTRGASCATNNSTDDHLAPFYSPHTFAPSDHVAWQVDQFLSTFGVDLGVQSESSALISAFNWAKTELQKREQEAQRWKARSEELLQGMTQGAQNTPVDGVSSTNDGVSQSAASTTAISTALPPGSALQLKKAWDRNEELDAELKKLQELLKKSRHDNATTQADIADLKQELSSLSQLQNENTNLQKKYTEANNGWNEYYAKFVTTSNDLQKTKQELSSVKATNGASVEKIVSLMAELDAANTSRNQAEAKVNNLHQSIRSMESNHAAALSKAKVDKKTQVPKLQTRLAELSAENSKLKTEMADLKKENASATSTIQGLQDALRSATKSFEETLKELQSKKDAADVLNVSLEQERKKSADLLQKKNKAVSDGQKLDQELQFTKEKIQGLQKEKLAVADDLKEAYDGLDKYRKEVTKLQKKIRDVEGHKGHVAISVFEKAATGLNDSYDSLCERIRRLDSIRLALEQHNKAATQTFLETCGIDTTGVWHDDIPENLIDVIDRLGPCEYELAFPLTKLRDLDRTARGVPGEARMALVRVSFDESAPSFCVHLDPGDKADKHSPFVVRGTELQGPECHICAPEPNRLVYQITRYLFLLLRDGSCSLAEMYRTIHNTINNPATSCLVCAQPTGVSMRRAVPCTVECGRTLSFAPLNVYFPELRFDPAVLDLILHFLYAAAIDTTTLDLVPECPISKADLPRVINSFPPVDSKTLIQDIYTASRQTPKQGPLAMDKWRLVHWICSKFQGFLISAPEKMKVPSMPGCHQFVMVHGNLEKEKEFITKLASLSGGANTLADGGVAFHGTTPQRMFRVLTEGLKVMSGTAFMTHGQASGAGIYLAADPSRALQYALATPQTWKNGKYGGMRILLGCEVAGWTHVSNSVHIAKDPATVMMRYVFVVPQKFKAPIPGHVEPAMRSAFANVKVRNRP